MIEKLVFGAMTLNAIKLSCSVATPITIEVRVNAMYSTATELNTELSSLMAKLPFAKEIPSFRILAHSDGKPNIYQRSMNGINWQLAEFILTVTLYENN